MKADEGGGRPSDDLTRILGIDNVVQSKLKDLGIRRFEDLASLTANDVKGLSDTLGVKDRIAEENWVGQAQILGRGGETYFSRRVDHGTPIPPSAEPSAAAPKPAAPMPAPEPEAKAVFPRVSVATGSGAPVKADEGGGHPSEDLTRIRGIDAVVQAKLKELGIRRFEDLASLTANDVKGLSETLGVKDRIAEENWVGQAQILGRGDETYFSRRMDQGTPIPPSAEPSAAAPKAAAARATRARSEDSVSARVGRHGLRGAGESGGGGSRSERRSHPHPRHRSGPARTAERAWHPPLRGACKPERERRQGIGRRAGLQGSRRTGKLGWAGADLGAGRRDVLLAPPGPRHSGAAIGGADRRCSGDGACCGACAKRSASAAAPSAPQAASQSASSGASDVGYLRSVRSEALVGEDGAHSAIGQGDADDLKRIRGIGVLIEKKLNSLGILSYEQVANWTGADIERISNILDFKGRIERENWIEQARILATGGQTEFSRRGER